MSAASRGRKCWNAEEVKLPLTDFSSLSEAEREAAVREAATAESREPFDLANGPMLRVKLLRLSDEEHVVLLTMHHIVSDAWSTGSADQRSGDTVRSLQPG